MILVEAFLRTKTWIILQRVIAVTVQMCFVSGCWLNIHDEVNGLCLEHLGCGSWICTATRGNRGVSRALVSLTNGVSVSVTCVSPTTTMGDHCSAEMSHCPWKWHNKLSCTHIFLILPVSSVSQTYTHTKVYTHICTVSGFWVKFLDVL